MQQTRPLGAVPELRAAGNPHALAPARTPVRPRVSLLDARTPAPTRVSPLDARTPAGMDTPAAPPPLYPAVPSEGTPLIPSTFRGGGTQLVLE